LQGEARRRAGLDGIVHIRLKETYRAYSALPKRPKPIRAKVTALTRKTPKVVSPLGHQWRKPFLNKKLRHAR
jgi:hypothetical protein